MSSLSPFVTLEMAGDASMDWAIQHLHSAGLKVVRTFDLQEARLTRAECPCPHHGTDACNCQMSIMLIYETEAAPVSVLLHSFEEITWLYLVDTPEQPVDPNLRGLIQDILTRGIPASVEPGK